jgi:hypothetical protein
MQRGVRLCRRGNCCHSARRTGLYANLSDKDRRVATAQREQKAPTLEQVKHVINSMLASTDIEIRNRALIAFTGW